MNRLTCILLLLLLAVNAVADVITDTNRIITWSNSVGIVGGIPRRSTIFSNINAGTAIGTIQAALNACPSNQVVLLASGGYDGAAATLQIPSYVSLRGAGMSNSVITNVMISFGPQVEPAPGTFTTISSGATKDSRQIVVASASGISAGTLLMVAQSNPAWVSETGAGGTCGWCDRGFTPYNMGQIVLVTNVSGTTLDLDLPIYFPLTSSPRAWRFTPGCVRGGVEDLCVYSPNSSGRSVNFMLNGTSSCWLTNVQSDFSAGDHVEIYFSHRAEVRHSFFHDGFFHGPGGYDDQLVMGHKSSGCLIEDNIFYRMHVSVMTEWGAAGNVIAYNFSTNNYHDASINIAWMINDMLSNHGSHPSFNLWEGNIGQQFRIDDYWGTGSHTTWLRNYAAGARWYSPPHDARAGTTPAALWQSQNNYCFAFDSRNISNNVIGNMAGSAQFTAAFPTAVTLSTNSTSNPKAAYRYNWDDNDTFGPTVNFSSSLHHGNYAFKDNLQQFAAGVDNTIPNSYYLTGKPAWFGNCPWPPMQPGNPSAFSSTNIPAGYRFYFAREVPTGNSDTNAPFISAVSTNSITTNSFVVRFITDETATGSVLYGLTTNLGSTVTGSSGTSNNISVTGLNPGTLYYFRPSAIDASANSTNGALSSATTLTPLDTAAPVITAVSTNSVTNNAYTVTWTTDEPAKGQVDFGPTSSYGQSVTESSFATNHSVRVSGVPANAVSHFRVHECDVLNNCTNDVDRTVTTTLDPDVTPPSISSTNVAVTVNSATVTWTSGENSDSALFWGLTTSYGNSSTDTNLVTSHSVQIVNLPANTLHYFKLSSTDAAGNQTNKTGSFTTSAPSTNSYNGPGITLKVIR